MLPLLSDTHKQTHQQRLPYNMVKNKLFKTMFIFWFVYVRKIGFYQSTNQLIKNCFI